MKLLFDFFPMFIFYIGFKFYGVYIATAAAIIASFVQVFFHRIKYKHYQKMHLVALGIILILGGATIFFHNPWFIKWKPTVIYWISSLIFLTTSFFGKKPLIQTLMGANLSLDQSIWHRLNLSCAVFFCIMGGLNLYVAYTYDMNVWVNFKLFGGLGLTTVFMVLLGIYLNQYLDNKPALEKKAPGNLP